MLLILPIQMIIDVLKLLFLMIQQFKKVREKLEKEPRKIEIVVDQIILVMSG